VADCLPRGRSFAPAPNMAEKHGPGMERVVVIGNSGGGKSTLARRVAERYSLPYHEIDTILWEPGWRLADEATYKAEHARLIAEERWVLDGLGTRDSIPERLARATDIILIDMPVWMHYRLAAERHIAWITGHREHVPAGMTEPPPLDGLFKNIWDVDRSWMPEIRSLIEAEELRQKRIFRLTSVDDLGRFIHHG
jgi:adenylate kinase family enzyme